MENKNHEENNLIDTPQNETQPKEQTKVDDKKYIPKKKKQSVKTYIFSIFSIIFLGASFFLYNEYVINANKIPVKKISYHKDIKTTIYTKKAHIYYPNDTLTKFISAEVEISKENFHLEANSIFLNIKSHSNYLIKGKNNKYYQFMDPSIVLLNSYLVGDKLYLNLSHNVREHIHSKKQELYILYSLVNTYTSIPGVKKVKILIDGAEVDRLKWYSLKTFYTKNLNI
jgi:hypothetical protein